MKIVKHPIIADRVRKIDGSFSFIPHQFITQQFFTSLNQHELLLYFLLVLVGDRCGLSYYCIFRRKPATHSGENCHLFWVKPATCSG